MHNEQIATLFIRLLAGCLFFYQGYDKVLRVGVTGVIDTFREPANLRKLPVVLLSPLAYFTSYVELIAGFLLIIGFVKYYALLLLGIDLLLVAFAFSMLKPMWDMQYYFPRFILLVALLLLSSQWDTYSVDYVWSLFKF